MSEKVDNTIFAVYSSAHADNQISSSGSPITLTSTTSGTSALWRQPMTLATHFFPEGESVAARNAVQYFSPKPSA